ncbi:DNA-binding MarR family transcriptional regulator [Microlunatus panaciterrae]|uniref:DNA-binding MarR family transcriptional regulator n=1 Tax=Microlunatus panaciterrae TaxID=400768 RepID=A0ABS2RII4_9ACTN|nr:DNA-binding MarR family transcriptional regulator [Microlunatus panaciterrae]
MSDSVGPQDRLTEDEQITISSTNLRGLTHPLRVKLLGLLRTGGRATATSLAAQLQTTSGAVSYHLRQLERYGFITEDTGHGNGRERWWRARHQRSEYDELSQQPADAEIARWFTDQIAAEAARRVLAASRQWRSWPPEWRSVFSVADSLLALTPTEAKQLGRDLQAVVDGYRPHRPDEPAPAGTAVVAVQFQTFLQPVDPS